MAWFIVATKRITITKSLVEADDAESALDCDDGYLGYVDIDYDERCPQCPGLAPAVDGPFDSKDAALDDTRAWTEG